MALPFGSVRRASSQHLSRHNGYGKRGKLPQLGCTHGGCTPLETTKPCWITQSALALLAEHGAKGRSTDPQISVNLALREQACYESIPNLNRQTMPDVGRN